MDDLIRLIVEQAPTVAALLYLVWRQDARLAELEGVLIELLRALKSDE